MIWSQAFGKVLLQILIIQPFSYMGLWFLVTKALCTLFIMFLRYPVFLLCNIVWICPLLKLNWLVYNNLKLAVVNGWNLHPVWDRFGLSVRARIGNCCAGSLQFSRPQDKYSCHSGLISQSWSPTDQPVIRVGSSGHRASGSEPLLRKAEVVRCAAEGGSCLGCCAGVSAGGKLWAECR